jgi:hypothetical protein
MAKFINNKTGNTLTVTNAKAIELMEKSDRYTKVTEAKEAKAPKAKA